MEKQYIDIRTLGSSEEYEVMDFFYIFTYHTDEGLF